ncbi:MAG TPA: sigma 54-interacting transcriptional regulator [Smithellaceae bacterium]|nr:sigma 54-interacting transcriptional regulator [Smithellaceae bacterium]
METSAVTDYTEEKHRQTFEEWQKFIAGDTDIDTSIIPPHILDAWVRCRALGVDPVERPKNPVLTGSKLQKLIEKNYDFINTSLPFMRNLYRFLKGSGFLVCLFDAEGFILEILGDHDDEDLVRRANGIIGASWNEKYVGNNAAGTIVELRKPVQIFACQHYNQLCHKDTGAGAPIFDPDGNFLGGMTLNARYCRANAHTLGMTVAAAHAIENELKTQRALAEAQIASRYQQTVITSIPEALITIDNDGFTCLINDNAKKMFSLDVANSGHQHIRKMFGEQNQQFFSLVENDLLIMDTEVRIFSGHSSNDYTLTCNPIFSPVGKLMGKVLIFNELNRAKTLVTKMIGAKANFHFDDICGKNRKFLMTIEQARMVSQSNSNVLLLGESGTGKDIFAQSIHNESDRKNGPYVAINCAAIPRDLITSELFGYAEGAFTGARRGGNHGKFELADGGTIFLDEIAETPLDLQAVLLRVIEDKFIVRLGGTSLRPVNVRVIAATNKDLRKEVEKGNFREDLYYRLNVFAISMVPLSERPDDIPLLIDLFVKKYAGAMGKHIDRIDDKVIEIFKDHPWPGNVRELQNVIERMMNLTTTSEITAEHIPSEILHEKRDPELNMDFKSPKHLEKEMITKMIRMEIPKNKIAKALRVSRTTLYRKIEKYHL